MFLMPCWRDEPEMPGFHDSGKLCGFAPLREKTLNRNEWIGSMVGRCQRCRGVKIDPRKGAKTQRKMGFMVDSYVLDALLAG